MPKGWAWLGQICIEKFTYVKNIFKQIKKKIIKKKVGVFHYSELSL